MIIQMLAAGVLLLSGLLFVVVGGRELVRARRAPTPTSLADAIGLADLGWWVLVLVIPTVLASVLTRQDIVTIWNGMAVFGGALLCASISESTTTPRTVTAVVAVICVAVVGASGLSA